MSTNVPQSVFQWFLATLAFIVILGITFSFIVMLIIGIGEERYSDGGCTGLCELISNAPPYVAITLSFFPPVFFVFSYTRSLKKTLYISIITIVILVLLIKILSKLNEVFPIFFSILETVLRFIPLTIEDFGRLITSF